MAKTSEKTQKRVVRRRRIRSRVKGTAEAPRLAVFKSNRYIYAQLIDDGASKTLLSVGGPKKGEKKTLGAAEVGKLIAEGGKAKGLKKVVFDRGGFIYTGQVKALADAAREAGLEF